MKIINKLITITVAVFMIFQGTLSGLAAESEEITEITVGDAEGVTGELVEVPISISSNSGLGAAEFILSYDNARLEVAGAKEGSAADEGCMTAINTSYSDDSIKLCYINPDGLYDEGSLFVVTFRIIETRLSKIYLKLEVPEFKDSKGLNDIPYSYNYLKGSVKVVRKKTDNDNTDSGFESITDEETPGSGPESEPETITETAIESEIETGKETEMESETGDGNKGGTEGNKGKPAVPGTSDNSNIHIFITITFILLIVLTALIFLLHNKPFIQCKENEEKEVL